MRRQNQSLNRYSPSNLASSRMSRRNAFKLNAVIVAAPLAACHPEATELHRPIERRTDTKQTLTQWYHQYGETGVQEAVRKFAAAYPKADVSVQWTTGDYGRQLSSALLSNNVPDVFEFASGASLDMIKAGHVIDLTDIIAPIATQFNPAIIKRLTFKEKIYSIPQIIDMQLLYYRPSLLKKVGVAPPTTFAALMEAAKALKTKTMGGFFAGKDGGIRVLSNILIWASGNEQLNENRTKAAFINQSFYDAIVTYRDFYNSGYLVKNASTDWYSASPIINGETAMQWGGLWSLPKIQTALKNDIGVLAFPAIGPNGRQVVPIDAFGACVASRGKNPKLAKEFVKWLWIDQENYQVEFANNFGTHIPAKTALISRTSKISSGPGLTAAKLASRGFISDIMWTGVLGSIFHSAVAKCITANADPRTEFAIIGDRAIAELKRAGT